MTWCIDFLKNQKKWRCGAYNFLEWSFITINLSKKSEKYGNEIRFVVKGSEKGPKEAEHLW
jgi:hypothetical protein